MPRIVFASLAAATCIALGTAEAQTTLPPTQPGYPVGATLSHSALKATTFKIAATLAGWFVYSAAAGDVVGGTALTAFTTVGSWLIYTGNDYLWDTYAPPPAQQNFDKAAAAWRTTKKFLTFTPAVIVLAWGSIYVYTGSVATTLAYGSLMSVVKPAVFYGNNMAWDYYDWYSAQTVAKAPSP